MFLAISSTHLGIQHTQYVFVLILEPDSWVQDHFSVVTNDQGLTLKSGGVQWWHEVVAFYTCISLGGGPLLDGGVDPQQSSDDSCLFIRVWEATGAGAKKGKETFSKEKEGCPRELVLYRLLLREQEHGIPMFIAAAFPEDGRWMHHCCSILLLLLLLLRCEQPPLRLHIDAIERSNELPKAHTTRTRRGGAGWNEPGRGEAGRAW